MRGGGLRFLCQLLSFKVFCDLTTIVVLLGPQLGKFGDAILIGVFLLGYYYVLTIVLRNELITSSLDLSRVGFGVSKTKFLCDYWTLRLIYSLTGVRLLVWIEM